MHQLLPAVLAVEELVAKKQAQPSQSLGVVAGATDATVVDAFLAAGAAPMFAPTLLAVAHYAGQSVDQTPT